LYVQPDEPTRLKEVQHDQGSHQDPLAAFHRPFGVSVVIFLLCPRDAATHTHHDGNSAMG
jgi:hypothetical protein